MPFKYKECLTRGRKSNKLKERLCQFYPEAQELDHTALSDFLSCFIKNSFSNPKKQSQQLIINTLQIQVIRMMNGIPLSDVLSKLVTNLFKQPNCMSLNYKKCLFPVQHEEIQ